MSDDKWIPVSKKMPKLGERCLCQCRANILEVLTWTKDGWYQDEQHCYMDGFVIAWLKIPDPYMEVEE